MSFINLTSDRLRPLVYLSNNWISFLGVLFVTTGGVAWLFTLPAHLAGGHPYLGILSILLLPAMFFLGLALIPLGIRLKERRQERAGIYPSSFPPLDWKNERFRNLVGFIGIATMANVVIGGHLTHTAVNYMDSTPFCGTTCHIMAPEYAAYQAGPHAHVDCIDCHIGEGALSMVEAKLNGAKQVVQVITGFYPRPVPSPVPNLAQGNITCADCHADLDFGNRRREWLHYAPDESNTASRTELLIAIGGRSNVRGAHGAHMGGGARTEFRTDPKRETIPWMRHVDPDGSETIYASPDWDPARAEEYQLRTMDCIDCHNRPAHAFEVPGKAVDRAMAEGAIDPSLPYVKRESMRLIQASYESQQQAAGEITERLLGFYRSEYPEVAAARAGDVEAAARELIEIYNRNVFPDLNFTWGTHPNHIGHEDYPGCYRCHTQEHVSQDAAQRPVGGECRSCHAMLAVDEPVREIAPTVTLTTATDSGLPGVIGYPNAAGQVGFDHAEHVDLVEGRCADCHNQLFQMDRGRLNYAADLHRVAEANRTSCAGCHVAGGTAFASANNCEKCHAGLSVTPPAVARAAPPPRTRPLLPGEVFYETSLGRAVFDHREHVDLADGNCTACHNALFPMEKAPLNYAADLHRVAEANRTSCAGCHVEGGEAFASADHCEKCHIDLGTPRPTPDTGVSGIPAVPNVDTRLGKARFGHERHVELANGDCQACHNKIFPLAKGLLNYADDLHRTAERERTSCGACHRPGGEAFASENNCLQCHDGMAAEVQGSLMGLPARAVYENRLGDVVFNHDEHIVEAEGRCIECHLEVFPLAPADLSRYSEDYHRTAESEKSQCAACHSPGRGSFGSLNNCTRCHQTLELRRSASLLGGLPWALFLFVLAVPGRVEAQSSGYVGSERCAVCHEEESREFRTNPHVALEQSAGWESQETACEACHGPGLAHVQALEPAELAVWGNAQPDRVNQSCLDCHAAEVSQIGRSFSAHARNEIPCTGCHQIHGAPQRNHLAKRTNALCGDCHSNVLAEFNRPFTHRLREGAMDCVDCHNPHGDPPPSQMTRLAANESGCLKCHADKRGPFPFEHAPVRLEPCSSCHEAHGSSNPRMMTRHNVAQLCLECHTFTAATLGGSPTGFHDLRSARFRSCTSCHSKIHGSFVNPDFLR